MTLFENKDLLSPKDLAGAHIISISKQHEERRAGRLKHVRIGRKVAYLKHHLTEYLALCEQGGQAVSGGVIA